MRKQWLLFGGVVCTLSCQPARTSLDPGDAGGAPAAEERVGGTFIRGAHVFDGERFLPAQDLWLKEGIIYDLAPSLKEPSDARVIDAREMTALPGFIDAHTHTFLAEHLAQAAVFGVTTELDMLAAPENMLRLKQQRSSGALGIVADLRSAGNGILALSDFGDYDLVDAQTNVLDFVSKRVEEGSDYIKILQDDGSMWGLAWPSISPQVVQQGIEAAHQHDLLAVVHAPEPTDSLHAVANGSDGLISLYGGGANPELVQALSDHGTFLVPTMSFMMDLCSEPVGSELRDDPRLAPYLSPSAYDALARERPALTELPCEDFRQALRDLVAADVLLLAGTDAPQPGVEHGVSLHAELSFLIQAGATVARALYAATRGPADAFGLKDRGRLAPGMRADVLLVGPGLEQDIVVSRDIRHVFVEGQEVARPRHR